jgi:membrane-anchored protein YejM (alkaline phosphatase superfamily)
MLALLFFGLLAERILQSWISGDGVKPRAAAATFAALSIVSLTSLFLVHSGRVFSNPEFVSTVLFETTYLRRAANTIQKATDGDGDGFPRIFGATDPDDSDPTIHPLAVDIPGDGIDQDGDGRDQTLLEDRERRARLTIDFGTAALPTPELDRVILITVDALRNDRLNLVNDWGQPLYPYLSLLASKGTRFHNAYSPSSGTSATFRSVLSGSIYAADMTASFLSHLSTIICYRVKYAPMVLYRDEGKYMNIVTPVDREVVSEVRLEDLSVLRRRGRLGVPSSPALTDSVLSNIQNSPVPSFHWVHYFDLHDWHDAAFLDSLRGESDSARYNHAVTFVDDELGRFYRGLESKGLLNRTAIILTSDHGEALGEHGIRYHGHYVWESVVRVPLILIVPNREPTDVFTPVSLINLGPTIAELFGTSWSSPERASLLPLLDADIQEPQPVFLDEAFQTSVVLGNWKLIVSKTDRFFRLHNIAEDPDEANNLVFEDLEKYQELRALLALHLERGPVLFSYR